MMAREVESIEKSQKAPQACAPARARHSRVGVSRVAFGAAATPQPGGNLAAQRLFRAGAAKAEFAISRPGDPGEQQADRVAEQVVSAKPAGMIRRDHAACAGGAACVERADGKTVRPKQEPGHVPRVDTTTAPQIDILTDGGQPLPALVRAFFEPRFGQDFSRVSIHTGSSAAQSARAVHAKAYTVGQDMVFGAGEYAPDTTQGRRLLAHELVHVLQQSSGQATLGQRDGGRNDPPEQDAERIPHGAPAERATPAAAAETQPEKPMHSNGLPVLQRRPDEGEGEGPDEPPEFDPEQELESELSALDLLVSLGNPKEVAPARRLKLLLQASEPDWPDRASFDKFFQECSKTAESEADTIAALGDPDLGDPEAFPETWSERLQENLTLSYPQYQLQRVVEAARAEMQKSAGDIPGEIFEHGLPVDFAASLGLQSFQLSSLLGVSFAWTTTPAGIVSIGPGPLLGFTSHALEYLRALNEADFISLWIHDARSVVEQVQDGELSVDPQAYERYKQRRPHGVPPDEIESSRVAGIPEPLGGRIDPAVAESYVTSIAGLVTFGGSLGHANAVVDVAAQAIAETNSRVAAENPLLRQQRASRWGHEHGFYSEALDREWEDIKEHAVEIGVGMAEDVAKYTIVQFIPIVNVVADIYLAAQLFMDVADTIGDLASADEEARDAKTAAALQRAAAHQATALSSAARKVANAIVMHHASKAAGKVAGKVRDRSSRGEGPKIEAEAAQATEDPARTRERGKQRQAESEKQAARESATERLPGEPAEPLPKDGEARVTAEGRCKICHSPCQYALDRAREVLSAASGTAYAGYAENLFRRIQLLDEAMESSSRQGTLKTDYQPRFSAALTKLSAEVEAAHRTFVGAEQGLKPPAVEEIESFEAGRERGIMNDPSRYQRGNRPERGLEGTAYHKRIQAAVVRSLPHDSAFSEDTIQGYLERQGVDPAAIPDKSAGIDLYILDNPRPLIVPVDITSIAGGKRHVGKLNRDVSRLRGALERVGLHLAEPIEIEYVGMTFDEAASSIVAELKAHAYPPPAVRGGGRS